jgi:hypothetical protein
VINPLAIGVTIGGLLLDVLVPRPKPRVGFEPDLCALLSHRRPEDTLVDLDEEHERPPVASGLASAKQSVPLM